MGTEGTLAPLVFVPSSPSTPTEYSASPVELLLRAKLHMERAAAAFALAGEELLHANGALHKARPGLGSEVLANVMAVGTFLTLRKPEAMARSASLALYAQSVEDWAGRLPCQEASAPAAQAAEEGGGA